jgi:ribulose-phosphate 3-epimerase
MAMIAPSLLSANFADLAEEIRKIEKGGADYLHLDVMDGNYVPNITFGAPLIKSIKKISSIPFDVHLMVDKPERFIKDFVDAGADILTVHAEATTHLHRTIQEIKHYGIKAGVALNPATPLNVLEYVLGDIDLVLLMTVNPGFGGQSFINATKSKIKSLRQIIDSRGLDIILEIDGGVKLSNAKELAELGVDLLVSGSDIFGAADIEAKAKAYKDLFDKAL